MEWLVTYVEYDEQPGGNVRLSGMKYNVKKTVDGDTTELNGVFNFSTDDTEPQVILPLADLQAKTEPELVELLHQAMGVPRVKQTEGMLDLAIRNAQSQHKGFVPADLNDGDAP